MSEQLTPPEEQLLDFAERLTHHRKGRSAVFIRLSKLAPHNRQENQLRLAGNSFERLVNKYEGHLFLLSNDDLYFIGLEVPVPELEDIALKLSFMFRDDPFDERADDPGAEPFAVIYTMKTDYFRFVAQVRNSCEECEQVALPDPEFSGERQSDSRRVKKESLKELTPDQLGRIEAALKTADLTPLIRQQAACAITGERPPKPVFYERYVSDRALERAFLPTVDITRNAWLYRHLGEAVQKRLIPQVGPTMAGTSLPNSINLAFSTVFSDSFGKFEEATRALRGEQSIIVELAAAEVLADVGTFIFVRDFLRSHDFRICVDELDALSLIMIDRQVINADILKIRWNARLESRLSGRREAVFRDAIAKAGAGRIVLCNSDDSQAFTFGAKYGLHVYQGQAVDARLAGAATSHAVNQ